MVPALLTKVIKASHHTSLDNPLNEFYILGVKFLHCLIGIKKALMMSSGLCNVINVYSILNTAALNPYFWTQVHIFINRCLFHDFFYWIVKLIKNLICCIFGYKITE